MGHMRPGLNRVGLIRAGLSSNGHYEISFENTLSMANGADAAIGLLAKCEQDFDLMSSWFPGVDFKYSFPIPVHILNDVGGAGWNPPSNFQVALGTSPTITIKPIGYNPGYSMIDFIRYLLVMEVTEMFMASQDKGWFENTSLFSGADEGSMGEGLSRFLGVQFLLANHLGSVPPAGFGVTNLWLNYPDPSAPSIPGSARQNFALTDFVDNNPDDHKQDPTTGCTTCFLYYLQSQLGKSINAIIAAGSSNLAGVYQNLTGKTDAWASFINLVNSHYPPGFSYNPASDNIFPVSELTQFLAPNQITCGYSKSTQIFISHPAMAEVNIDLNSDDTGVVSVPDKVTVPVGATATDVPIQAAAIAGPFPMKSVLVHATYAGQTLPIDVEVVPPRVASVTLAPATVTCGDSSVATVTLNLPSLDGPVVVDLLGSSGFATVPVPPQLTIPQDQLFNTFTVNAPASVLAFTPAHVSIGASYSGLYAWAMLTVKSRVVAGILQSLVVFPSTVQGGAPSRGSVTLFEAVPVATAVALAAIEPLDSLGGHLPDNQSSIVSVPSSIIIPAGQTTGGFNITTHHITPATRRNVTIMAAAVVTKYALLTVSA